MLTVEQVFTPNPDLEKLYQDMNKAECERECGPACKKWTDATQHYGFNTKNCIDVRLTFGMVNKRKDCHFTLVTIYNVLLKKNALFSQ